MKNKTVIPVPVATTEPSQDLIRDYAFHLYEQSQCAPGHDLDNWLEATACLKANIPMHRSGSRLHQHVNGPERDVLYALTAEENSLPV